MRRSATRRDIPASTRKAVEPCADTLLNKKSMLRQDEYLANGMPIATGVIEGACRHLVAQAVLRLCLDLRIQHGSRSYVETPVPMGTSRTAMAPVP